MTPEQIELARKHKILPLHDSEFPEYFAINEADLAAYTAAVEARYESDILVRDEYVEELRARERELTRKLAEQQALNIRLRGEGAPESLWAEVAYEELNTILAKERERVAFSIEEQLSYSDSDTEIDVAVTDALFSAVAQIRRLLNE